MNGAPLPVREFTTAADLLAHYAALNARLTGARDRSAFLRHAPPQTTDGVPEDPVPLIAAELVEPGPARSRPDPWRDFVERTRKTFGDTQVQSTQQLEGRAEMSGTRALRLTSTITGISVGVLCSERRTAPVSKARQIAGWLITKRAGKSLLEAGDLLNRDHTSVLHGNRKVEAAMVALAIDPKGDAAEIATALWAASWASGQAAPS